VRAIQTFLVCVALAGNARESAAVGIVTISAPVPSQTAPRPNEQFTIATQVVAQGLSTTAAATVTMLFPPGTSGFAAVSTGSWTCSNGNAVDQTGTLICTLTAFGSGTRTVTATVRTNGIGGFPVHAAVAASELESGMDDHFRTLDTVVVTSLRGDADGDRVITVNDIFRVINFLFAAGPAPIDNSDVNGDSRTDVLDVFYFINYIFGDGPAPVATNIAPPYPSSGTGAGPSDGLALSSAAAATGSSSVRIPVLVRDASGTAIGRDKPIGWRISQLAFQVTYGPASCLSITDIDISTGVLAGRSYSMLQKPGSAAISKALVFSSSDDGSPIPFETDTWTGIGELVVNTSGCPAGVYPLTITTAGANAAALGCDQCSFRDVETVEAGTLSVQNGSITLAPGPAITGVTPNIGPTAGGTQITIAGSNFEQGATVTVGGVAAAVTSVAAASIVATTAPHAYGVADVTLRNPNTVSATRASGYTFDNKPIGRTVATPSTALNLSTITWSGATSSDPDAAQGDSIAAYKFYFADGASSIPQTSATIARACINPGPCCARVQVKDQHGVWSDLINEWACAWIAEAADDAEAGTYGGVPTTMTRNQSVWIYVQFRNLGTNTWSSAAGYEIQTQNPQANGTFGISRVSLGAQNVSAGGQTGVIQFQITAPSTRGKYNFQLGMTHNGVAFGDFTTNIQVTVK
jgi:hypothetical protein